MPGHPSARHLTTPAAEEILTIAGPVEGVVELWYELGDGVRLTEGCEVLASTERGEMFVRYRCSDDDRLYEGWVRLDALTVAGRAKTPEPLDAGDPKVGHRSMTR